MIRAQRSPIQIAREVPATELSPPPKTLGDGAFQYTVTIRPRGRVAVCRRAPVGIAIVAHRGDASVEPLASRAEAIPQADEGLVFARGGDPSKDPLRRRRQRAGEGAPGRPSKRELTGKVIAIHYDRFGDFRGLT